jgi:glucokinase
MLPKMILAGDIGGTNTRLAFFEIEDNRPRVVIEQVFRSREHTSLEEVVEEFVAEHKENISRACFGVAGPVRDGKATTANLPWIIEASRLAKVLSNATVMLVNDLEANAYGLSVLEEKDFVVLNGGSPDAQGNEAIISAGTGLGEAGLRFEGGTRHPFASEGGHADFSPRCELQIELLRFLMARYSHVSCERVLSGPGLLNIYGFFRDGKGIEEPAWLAEKMRNEDPSAVISQVALGGQSDLCVQSVEMFVSIYGGETGNLALRMLATGGVFLGGGIAPKIISHLKAPVFIESFIAKGRMQPLLESIPVRVIMNDQTALLGAAMRAAAVTQAV